MSGFQSKLGIWSLHSVPTSCFCNKGLGVETHPTSTEFPVFGCFRLLKEQERVKPECSKLLGGPRPRPSGSVVPTHAHLRGMVAGKLTSHISHLCYRKIRIVLRFVFAPGPATQD